MNDVWKGTVGVRVCVGTDTDTDASEKMGRRGGAGTIPSDQKYRQSGYPTRTERRWASLPRRVFCASLRRLARRSIRTSSSSQARTSSIWGGSTAATYYTQSISKQL